MPLSAALFDDNEPAPGSPGEGASQGRTDMRHLFGGDDCDDDLALLRGTRSAGDHGTTAAPAGGHDDATPSALGDSMLEDDAFEFLRGRGSSSLGDIGHRGSAIGSTIGALVTGSAPEEARPAQGEHDDLWHFQEGGALSRAMLSGGTSPDIRVEERPSKSPQSSNSKGSPTVLRQEESARQAPSSQTAQLAATPQDPLADAEMASDNLAKCAEADDGLRRSPRTFVERTVPLPGPWGITELPRYSLQNATMTHPGPYKTGEGTKQQGARFWRECRAKATELLKASIAFDNAVGVP
mmetsp:Transcript_24476/g.70248  ORF Transcript_24476/g.70248 Transcript_24476/m.70248 type:complete len:296 (-) Transcript_24476:192-1079(-)